MPPAVLFRRLLLLPLLAPVLAVLLVGAINPRPWVGLRLLIWRSPEWTIGSWIALAAGGGAALSATATALALQAGAASNRRQLHRPIPEARSRRAWPWGRSEADGPTQARGDGPGQEPAPAQAGANREGAGTPRQDQAWAGPSRHPSDPQPTLSVPFRVIRRAPAAGRESGPLDGGTVPSGTGMAGANGWSPSGPQPDPQTGQQGPRRRGLWPLGNRQQAQPAQAPAGPNPADPVAVDRSWQVGPDADW